MTRKEKIEQTQRILADYAKIDLQGRAPDPVNWVAFRMGCTPTVARSLITAAEALKGSGA